jgi:hypothetical protein
VEARTDLILRSRAARGVSKDGQHAPCLRPPFETHRCAMLLRVRWSS